MFVHIGYEHYLDASQIEVFLPPGSSSTKRRVKMSKKGNEFHDCSLGHSWKSVIVMRDGHVYVSHLTSLTIVKRINRGYSAKDHFETVDIIGSTMEMELGGGAGGGLEGDEVETLMDKLKNAPFEPPTLPDQGARLNPNPGLLQPQGYKIADIPDDSD